MIDQDQDIIVAKIFSKCQMSYVFKSSYPVTCQIALNIPDRIRVLVPKPKRTSCVSRTLQQWVEFVCTSVNRGCQ